MKYFYDLSSLTICDSEGFIIYRCNSIDFLKSAIKSFNAEKLN